VERATGTAPRIAYEVLLDMGRPWVDWLPAINVHGNIGSRSPVHPAAAPQYTRVALSEFGWALSRCPDSAASILSELLTNRFHNQGLTAPFHPHKVAAVVSRALSGRTEALHETLGSPAFVTKSRVDCDALALTRHGRAEITVSATVESQSPTQVRVKNLPSQSSSDRIAHALACIDEFSSPELQRLASVIADVDFEADPSVVTLRLHAPSPLAHIADALSGVDGFSESGPVELSQATRSFLQSGDLGGIAGAARKPILDLLDVLTAHHSDPDGSGGL
jgi:hypothetical protein